jgi:hypothetical protein
MSGLLEIKEIPPAPDQQGNYPQNFRAYSLDSTADTKIGHEVGCHQDTSVGINEILNFIVHHLSQDPSASIELVVQVHGYNTGFKEFSASAKGASAELARIQGEFPRSNKVTVFLCYHWPSENILEGSGGLLTRFFDAWRLLPGWLMLGGIVLGALTLAVHSLLSWKGSELLALVSTLPQLTPIVNLVLALPSLLLIVTVILLTIAVIFIGLRLVGYFQDVYRATNYGVLDLVQFFRAFQALAKDRPELAPLFSSEQGCPRIDISFIAHSMGAFVTTNVVRILSDVFHRGDKALIIDTIDGKQSAAQRDHCIGECFELNRLVLVSPDIPVNAILDNRSNFLASSLSRFKESYLFSNEGDMVLLLLSTVANYFSFPSTVEQMGYKLGNIGIKEDPSSYEYYMSSFTYIQDLKDVNDKGNVLDSLVIGIDHRSLVNIGDALNQEIDQENRQIEQKNRQLPPHQHQRLKQRVESKNPLIAQRITYFDCTDYLRQRIRGKSGWNLKPLGLYDYAKLIPFIGATHGAYFSDKNHASREAIYTIASQGFDQFCTTPNGASIIQGQEGIKILRAK